MKFISLEPFVPSGNDFEGAKAFFQELGFTMTWEMGGMAGFQNGECKFILQQYDNKEFAENFMLSVRIPDAAAFYQEANEKGLAQKYGIRISEPKQQPYGKEVNVIDKAGVCWHFVE